jgi:hypothetical protein
MGNSERRTVYKNFELLNLHTNAHDFLHANYERYLKMHVLSDLKKPIIGLTLFLIYYLLIHLRLTETKLI